MDGKSSFTNQCFRDDSIKISKKRCHLSPLKPFFRQEQGRKVCGFCIHSWEMDVGFPPKNSVSDHWPFYPYCCFFQVRLLITMTEEAQIQLFSYSMCFTKKYLPDFTTLMGQKSSVSIPTNFYSQQSVTIRIQIFLGFLVWIYLISLNFTDERKKFLHFNFLINICIKMLRVKNSRHME